MSKDRNWQQTVEEATAKGKEICAVLKRRNHEIHEVVLIGSNDAATWDRLVRDRDTTFYYVPRGIVSTE